MTSMDTTTHEMATAIQTKRMERGMDIYDLAKACDVNPVTLYRIERGASLPAVWLFARIIQALDWEPAHALDIAARIRTNHKRKAR